MLLIFKFALYNIISKNLPEISEPCGELITEHSPLIYVLFPPYILFFTYSLMLVAIVFLFFFKQHSNLLLLLLYIELCLFLIGFLFAILFLVSFSYTTGLVYALTILALSAAEAIIGLTFLLVYFRSNKGSIALKGFFSWKNVQKQ